MGVWEVCDVVVTGKRIYLHMPFLENASRNWIQTIVMKVQQTDTPSERQNGIVELKGFEMPLIGDRKRSPQLCAS